MWNTPFKPKSVLAAPRPIKLADAARQPAANSPRVLQSSRTPAQAQLSFQFHRG